MSELAPKNKRSERQMKKGIGLTVQDVPLFIFVLGTLAFIGVVFMGILF